MLHLVAVARDMRDQLNAHSTPNNPHIHNGWALYSSQLQKAQALCNTEKWGVVKSETFEIILSTCHTAVYVSAKLQRLLCSSQTSASPSSSSAQSSTTLDILADASPTNCATHGHRLCVCCFWQVRRHGCGICGVCSRSADITVCKIENFPNKHQIFFRHSFISISPLSHAMVKSLCMHTYIYTYVTHLVIVCASITLVVVCVFFVVVVIFCNAHCTALAMLGFRHTSVRLFLPTASSFIALYASLLQLGRTLSQSILMISLRANVYLPSHSCSAIFPSTSLRRLYPFRICVVLVQKSLVTVQQKYTYTHMKMCVSSSICDFFFKFCYCCLVFIGGPCKLPPLRNKRKKHGHVGSGTGNAILQGIAKDCAHICVVRFSLPSPVDEFVC